MGIFSRFQCHLHISRSMYPVCLWTLVFLFFPLIDLYWRQGSCIKATLLPQMKKCKNSKDVPSKPSHPSSRVGTLETRVAAPSDLPGRLDQTNSSLTKVNKQLNILESRREDTENRNRRSIHIFYGIEDFQNETWAQTEKEGIRTCSRLLNQHLEPNHSERAPSWLFHQRQKALCHCEVLIV